MKLFLDQFGLGVADSREQEFSINEVGQVPVPFGAEYQLVFENLSSDQVEIQVDIDGKKVVKDLYIPVGISYLTRPTNSSNWFKTAKKSEVQGVSSSDLGLISVTFWKLKPLQMRPIEEIAYLGGYSSKSSRGVGTVLGSHSSQNFSPTDRRDRNGDSFTIHLRLIPKKINRQETPIPPSLV